MVNYAVPTEPGRARLIHQVTLRKAMLPRVARLILSFRPAWVVAKQHMGASATLDGDSVFLKHQVSILFCLFFLQDFAGMPTHQDLSIMIQLH